MRWYTKLVTLYNSKLYLFKGTNTATKVANNETLVLAETITAKRQIEINHSEYGLIPKLKKVSVAVLHICLIGMCLEEQTLPKM